jgi:hypothetical protein
MEEPQRTSKILLENARKYLLMVFSNECQQNIAGTGLLLEQRLPQKLCQ